MKLVDTEMISKKSDESPKAQKPSKRKLHDELADLKLNETGKN